jgi:regulatory protein
MGGRRSRRGDGEPRDDASRPPEPAADPEQVARSICLRLLTLQPRTRADLAAALRKRDVPDDAAAAVLDRFSEVGLIDDAAFAAAWVTSRHRGRGLARRALASELHRRGVDPDTAGAALDMLDGSTEERTARELVERRLRAMGGLPVETQMRRLLGMLARKGYPGAMAARVVREACRADHDSAGDVHALGFGATP